MFFLLFCPSQTRFQRGQRGNDRRKSGSARVPSNSRLRVHASPPPIERREGNGATRPFNFRSPTRRRSRFLYPSVRSPLREGRRGEEANERASERARRGEDAAKRDAKLHTGGTEGQDLPRSLCCASYVCVNPGRAVNTRTLRARIAQSRRTDDDPTKRGAGGGGGGGGGAVE